LGCTNCVLLSGTLVASGKSVNLTWSASGFGQVRKYSIWRAVGSFPTIDKVVANRALFTQIKTLSGTPPPTTLLDNNNIKNNTTYTYFVTSTNKQGVQSAPSAPTPITVKF